MRQADVTTLDQLPHERAAHGLLREHKEPTEHRMEGASSRKSVGITRSGRQDSEQLAGMFARQKEEAPDSLDSSETAVIGKSKKSPFGSNQQLIDFETNMDAKSLPAPVVSEPPKSDPLIQPADVAAESALLLIRQAYGERGDMDESGTSKSAEQGLTGDVANGTRQAETDVEQVRNMMTPPPMFNKAPYEGIRLRDFECSPISSVSTENGNPDSEAHAKDMVTEYAYATPLLDPRSPGSPPRQVDPRVLQTSPEARTRLSDGCKQLSSLYTPPTFRNPTMPDRKRNSTPISRPIDVSEALNGPPCATSGPESTSPSPLPSRATRRSNITTKRGLSTLSEIPLRRNQPSRTSFNLSNSTGILKKRRKTIVILESPTNRKCTQMSALSETRSAEESSPLTSKFPAVPSSAEGGHLFSERHSWIRSVTTSIGSPEQCVANFQLVGIQNPSGVKTDKKPRRLEIDLDNESQMPDATPCKRRVEAPGKTMLGSRQTVEVAKLRSGAGENQKETIGGILLGQNYRKRGGTTVEVVIPVPPRRNAIKK